MGLPLLYSQPSDDDSWRSWSFNHAANHYDMLQAVLVQKNQNLTMFCLDPMDPDNLGLWLYQHQEMHNQVNTVLKTQGYDLLALDWDDPDQFNEWLRLNGDEHVRISTALNIG
jgi:hypothetical protein